MARKIKYTTVQIKEILAQPTLRLDPGYWIKKKAQASSNKPQAASHKLATFKRYSSN